MVSINTDHPIYGPLWQIVMYGYGPAAILPPLLSTVPGIDEAYIYGSWAARYLGEPGEDPNDVDVLVVGTADAGVLYEIARQATKTTGREVNIISLQRWDSAEDGFVQTVRSRPLLELDLEKP